MNHEECSDFVVEHAKKGRDDSNVATGVNFVASSLSWSKSKCNLQIGHHEI